MTLVLLALVAIVLSPRLALERLQSSPGTALRVQAKLPGLAPEQIERLVAQPLEAALHSLPSLRDIVVRCGDGQASIELRFRSTSARERALDEVSDRIEATVAQLPAGMEAPRVERIDPPLRAAAVYGIVAEPLTPDIAKWAERQLRRPLNELPETADVLLEGADALEILVEPDPRRLVALGLSFDDVVQALRGGDQAPAVRGARRRASTLPTSAEAIAVRALRLPGGEPIALAEAARVSVVPRPAIQRPTVDDRPALLLRVYPRSAAEAANVAERVQAHLAWLQANGLVPDTVKVHKLFDEADETSKWLRRVLKRIGVAVVLALAAVYLFFGARAGLIAMGAFAAWLPLTAAALWAFGLSLNVNTAAGIMFACVALALAIVHARMRIAVALVALAAVLSAWLGWPWTGAYAQTLAGFGAAALVSVPIAWLLAAYGRSADPVVSPVLGWLPSRWRGRALLASAMAALLLIATGLGVRTLPAAVADVSGGTMTLQLRGDDEQQLALLAARLRSALSNTPGISVLSNTSEAQSRWRLQLDDEALQTYDIGIVEVARQFEIARNGLIVGELVDADARMPLRVQLPPGSAGAAFERLPLRGERKDRPALYLRDVGTAERVTGMRERLRVQRQPAVEIRARWSGASLPAEVGQLPQRATLPPGYNMRLETIPDEARAGR